MTDKYQEGAEAMREACIVAVCPKYILVPWDDEDVTFLERRKKLAMKIQAIDVESLPHD